MSWSRLRYITLFGLVAVGFWMRLLYLKTSHPFFDEFTTILAGQEILRRGLPVLPSNLFYEHGLLFTYLDALALAVLGGTGQPAAGLSLEAGARWPSLLLGTLTIPVLYAVGRRWFNPWVGWLAAGLLALSPEGMVWGGRARMYTLATLLALLTAVLAYEGSVGPGRARLRRLALLALLATLLTHFGAMVMVGPLLVAVLAVAGFTRPAVARIEGQPRRSWLALNNWPELLSEGLGLGLVVFIAVLVKRLGQPLGAAPLGSSESGNLFLEALSAVSYQTDLSLDPAAALDFLARQFGVAHHLWLTVVVVAGAGVWLTAKFVSRLTGQRVDRSTSQPIPQPAAYLFTLLLFALIVLEMITLLPAWRRNPRYLVMFLPLFYLLVGTGVVNLLPKRWTEGAARAKAWLPLTILSALGVFSLLGYPDWQIAYRTPEPAYEVAFRYLQTQWQPGDAILTMNVSAVGLYFQDTAATGATYFPMQEDAGQFLLTAGRGQVDRWLGRPWIGDAGSFNRVLNRHPRAWFVTDTIRLPVYYRGDWLALLNSQMERVLETDNVILYRTRPDRVPLPTGPDVPRSADLGGLVRLTGFSLGSPSGAAAGLRLTLFWQALAEVPIDYTRFVHLRDADGATVAQADGQPLDGLYPTSQWRPGETLVEPVVLDVSQVPPGTYTLYAGLYNLSTLQRLPVSGDRGGENAVILGQVQIP